MYFIEHVIKARVPPNLANEISIRYVILLNPSLQVTLRWYADKELDNEDCDSQLAPE